MPDLEDGESIEVQGSGSSVYTIRNIGGVYSCSCPAWRNQSIAIETRSCKHIRRLRGDEAETARVGTAAAAAPRAKLKADGTPEESKEPPVLLAEPWDGIQDVSGWWISEKLDGVRAYWDGTQFLSRQGNRYVAPPWFTEGLPNQPLDGELWLDRKQFQRTVSIVRRQDQSDHWKKIRYVVFDAPGEKHPFEQRMEYLADLMQGLQSDFVALHTQQLCQNIAHLQQELNRVESLGGEGLMLRQPGSKYVAGRSSSLLKVKTFLDAEAEVIGHLAGAGRHKGRLGAVQVRLADGTEFSVGTGFSDAQREDPPAIGTMITFRYQELTDAGVPRFPSYLGVRLDVASGAAPPSAKVAGDHQVPSAASRPSVNQKSPAKSATKSAATPSTVPTTTAASVATRHFEYQDGKSDKFWEITVNGIEVTVRYGRNGTNGQTNTKSFANSIAAVKHADSLVQEKTKNGYIES